MNERILELFVHALEEFKAENKYATIIVPNPLQEKFAELIIQECANVADENYIHRGSRTCGLAIRLHFGVEE